MKDVIDFFVRYETTIYIILGIGALFPLRSLFFAFLEWKKAVFGLEKELAFNKVRAAGTILIIFSMLLISQFCVVSFIFPVLPSVDFLATPTLDLLNPPNTLSPEDLTAQPTREILPEGSFGCTAGKIVITSPAPGEMVSGKITIVGTINVENYGFYKYEYSKGDDIWVTIAAGDKIIINGDLGNWDVSQLVPGSYQLRLLVTDNVGNALPTCSIPVMVVE